LNGAKENPGALAGATGTNLESFWSWFDHNLNRQLAASKLVASLLNCEPADRVSFLANLLGQMWPDFPRLLLIDAMRECRDYAADLPAPYRKAMALACWECMPEAGRRAFLRHVTGATHG